MKWIRNDVTFERGNHREAIARFDNSRCWFRADACMTTQSFRYDIHGLANVYGAKVVELKYFYDENGDQTETNVVDFLHFDGKYTFRSELRVPEGCRREFVYYQPEQLFIPDEEA